MPKLNTGCECRVPWTLISDAAAMKTLETPSCLAKVRVVQVINSPSNWASTGIASLTTFSIGQFGEAYRQMMRSLREGWKKTAEAKLNTQDIQVVLICSIDGSAAAINLLFGDKIFQTPPFFLVFILQAFFQAADKIFVPGRDIMVDDGMIEIGGNLNFQDLLRTMLPADVVVGGSESGTISASLGDIVNVTAIVRKRAERVGETVGE